MARLRNLLRTKPGASQASSPARAVIGLRNPGSDYEGTRHNSGYEVLARVLERAGENLGRGPSRVQAQVTQVGVGEDRRPAAGELAGPRAAQLDFGSGE